MQCNDMNINIDLGSQILALLVEPSCWWWILKTSCETGILNQKLGLDENPDLGLDLKQAL